MFSKSRKKIFVLIVVGLLSAAYIRCGEGGKETDTDTQSSTDDLSDTDTGVDSAMDTDNGSTLSADSAAWVKLHRMENAGRVIGRVVIASEIRQRVIGAPTVELINASPATLGEMTISDMVETEEGFRFEGTWKNPPAAHGSFDAQVRLQIACDENDMDTDDDFANDVDLGDAGDGQCTDNGWCSDADYYKQSFEVDSLTQDPAPTVEEICKDKTGTTRVVRAVTPIELCDNECGELSYRSKNEVCWECWYADEPAPPPILPRREPDGLALPGSFHLDIKPVFVEDGMLVAIAEHRGTVGNVTYAWEVSAGTLADDDVGGVVWSLPRGEGPHLLQVAVRDKDSAAVASMRWPYQTTIYG